MLQNSLASLGALQAISHPLEKKIERHDQKNSHFLTDFFCKKQPFDLIQRPDTSHLTANSDSPDNLVVDRGVGSFVEGPGRRKCSKKPQGKGQKIRKLGFSRTAHLRTPDLTPETRSTPKITVFGGFGSHFFKCLPKMSRPCGNFRLHFWKIPSPLN